MEWLPTLISGFILVVNIIVAIVAYKTVYRHRVIYSIKTKILRIPKGTIDDKHAYDTTQIDSELKKGIYTILGIVERPIDKELQIFLGQIKKDNITVLKK